MWAGGKEKNSVQLKVRLKVSDDVDIFYRNVTEWSLLMVFSEGRRLALVKWVYCIYALQVIGILKVHNICITTQETILITLPYTLYLQFTYPCWVVRFILQNCTSNYVCWYNLFSFNTSPICAWCWWRIFTIKIPNCWQLQPPTFRLRTSFFHRFMYSSD